MAQKESTAEYSKVPTKELLKGLEDNAPKEYGYGVRHVQVLIMVFCLTISFVVRGHLGVTIVAMTHIAPVKTPDVNINNFTDEIITELEKVTTTYESKQNFTVVDKHFNITKHDCIRNNTESTQYGFETFEWAKPVQEMVLSSFFLGYCIMTFPAGMIAQRWGGKLPLQISMVVNGLVSIGTPWLATWGGWKAVCVSRIVQGCAQSGTFPSIQALLAKWVSINERGTLSSYVYTGTTIGTVIAFQLGGFLAESAWGWPSTFYVVGALCVSAFVVLTAFTASTPSEHRRISDEEKNFIMGCIDVGKSKQNKKTPWKAILSSKSVWACIVAQAGSGVAFIFFFTQVSSYIHYTFGINVKSSGLLSSLPYIASLFTSVGFGTVSDFCTNRNIVTLKNARRISNSISQIGIAVCLVLAAVASNTTIAVTCLVVGMGCQMGMNTGWLINFIDLAPNFAGTLISCGNVSMNFFVLTLPVLVSHIVVDVRNQHQWRIMFGVVAAFALLCNAVFVIFLSTDSQPWNECSEDIVMENVAQNDSEKEKQKC